MKKVYTYDYNQSVPKNTDHVEPTAGEVYSGVPEPVESTPPTQDINATQSVPDSSYTPDNPLPPEPVNYYDPEIKRSNLMPITVGIIIVLVIVAIIWVILPKTYEECVSFPGSSQENTFPPECSTFYGASFRLSTGTDIEGTQTPTIDTGDTQGSSGDLGFGSNVALITPAPTASIAGTTTESQASDTTKGGEPVVTPAPTVKPNPAPTYTPTNTFVTPAESWTSHRYPTQHIRFDLPDNYHGTTAIRNLDTGRTHFSAYASEPKNSLLAFEVKQGWSGWEGAQLQPVVFMIGDTGVVSVNGDAATSYYFEKDGWVFKATCHHLGNDGAKDLCVRILKSTQFI